LGIGNSKKLADDLLTGACFGLKQSLRQWWTGRTFN